MGRPLYPEMVWQRRDPALAIMRAVAWLTVAVYGALLVFIVMFIAYEEGPGEANAAIVMVAAMALPLAGFAWGLAAWSGRGPWLASLIGWLGMLAGTVPLISFSFVLLPLVLAASPMVLRRREGAITSPGRTAP